MKKILFACDLDNTLIHSYKHRADGDICIEIYNGREQSFISCRVAELLKKVTEKILFIPVTTRSVEQYQRINWLEDTAPKFAVTSNGANLICNSKIDSDWKKDFYKYIQPYEKELFALQEKFSQSKNFSICRIVDDSFLFLKCCNSDDTEKICNEIQAVTNLTVQNSGMKIYLFPPKLNKGEALFKLKEKFLPEKTFAAGDSIIDIPMLNLADISFNCGDSNFQPNNFFKFIFDMIY